MNEHIRKKRKRRNEAPWCPRKPNKVTFENGRRILTIFVSPISTRCPVCSYDATTLARRRVGVDAYNRYLSCTNPRCTVNGFKVNNEEKLIRVWLGKPIDYRTKVEEPTPVATDDILDNIDWGYNDPKREQQRFTEALEVWNRQHEEYKNRKVKSYVERLAERKLKDWYPEDKETVPMTNNIFLFMVTGPIKGKSFDRAYFSISALRVTSCQ